MPRRAAVASALTMVTGVEMTSAHGQAMTRMTSARYSQSMNGCPRARGGTTAIIDGDRQHHRRIDGGKPVKEALDGRSLLLRFLDQADDPRKCRIFKSPGHPHRERTAVIHGTRIDLCARGLFDRRGFAGDHGFHHAGDPRFHDAIERDALSRPDHEEFARPDASGRNGGLCAVMDHIGHLRAEVHQRANRTAGSGGTVGFKHQRKGKEHDHGRAFFPLPDEHGACDGNGHQEIHVEHACPESPDCLAEDVPSPYQDRGKKNCVGNKGRSPRAGQARCRPATETPIRRPRPPAGGAPRNFSCGAGRSTGRAVNPASRTWPSTPSSSISPRTESSDVARLNVYAPGPRELSRHFRSTPSSVLQQTPETTYVTFFSSTTILRFQRTAYHHEAAQERPEQQRGAARAFTTVSGRSCRPTVVLLQRASPPSG